MFCDEILLQSLRHNRNQNQNQKKFPIGNTDENNSCVSHNLKLDWLGFEQKRMRLKIDLYYFACTKTISSCYLNDYKYTQRRRSYFYLQNSKGKKDLIVVE